MESRESYTIRHPHSPYEDACEVHLIRLEGGNGWQVQVMCNGSLHDSDYFATEREALFWAAREAVTIAAVRLHDECESD